MAIRRKYLYEQDIYCGEFLGNWLRLALGISHFFQPINNHPLMILHKSFVAHERLWVDHILLQRSRFGRQP
jgi:hypothetical protein